MEAFLDYKELLKGYKGAVTTRIMRNTLMDEYHKTIINHPCIDLVESIINNKDCFSQNFIEIFLIIMLDRGFLSFKSIITILKVYNLLETCDEYFTEIISAIIEEILRTITDNLSTNAIGHYNVRKNYIGQVISDIEFDEIMFILANALEIDDEFYTSNFLSYIVIFDTYIFTLNKLLPSRWFSDAYLFNIIANLFDNQKLSLSITGINNTPNYAYMVSNVYIMYFNPNWIDKKIKDKLWIEQHECDFLIEKKNSRILYYSKVFGRGYRKIDDTKHYDLPFCLVEYMLEFVGLEEMDAYLRNGKF